MQMLTTQRNSLVLLVALLVLACGSKRGMADGFILGETKEQLKLQYDLSVQDHGTGRVTIVFTLADEGRMKPLDEVQFVIPAREKNPSGGHWMDLVVSIEMRDSGDGNRAGRIHILKSLAERAQLYLNTHTMDGKTEPRTRLHHLIPITDHFGDSSNAKPAAEPGSDQTDPPPATEDE